jgi:transglutaminase-like putative cysteine protease
MRYRVTHTTAYRYSEPASLSQNELFLTPRQTRCQRLIDTGLEIDPEPPYLHTREDYFGNTAQVFMVQHPHSELLMTAKSEVETQCRAVPLPATTLPWEEAVRRLASYGDGETLAAYQYVFGSPMISIIPEARAYARPSFPPGRPVLAGAVELMGRIYKDFSYDKSATNVDTTIRQVLKNRRGVCQDFSHLAIACLRSLGLAARYVSGYLETLPPPGKEKLVGADASHAWLSVFVPEAGWIDLDPTNNLVPGEQHITVAWGRDYGDVTPVKGVVMGGGVHTLSVMVDVAPVLK